MKSKEIIIDFTGIFSAVDMHSLLKESLKLPDFYGGNVNALIDCLSSLRFPEDEMIGIRLERDESLIIRTKNLSKLELILFNHFIIAVENANSFELNRGNSQLIYLIPV